MTINPQSVEEKAVYAALKDIFRDDRAKVRQLSKIRALVEQHSKKNDLSALIQLHGAESLCKSAQALLADSIFVSEDRAKARFAVLATTPAVPVPAKAATGGAPVLNLFADSHKGFEALGTEKTRVSESDTQISPAPAAKTQAQTMQSPLQSKINNLSATEHDVATTTKTADVEPETTTTTEPKLSTSMSNLPYEAQHQLLVCAQSCLENACFEFAEHNLRGILMDNAWDCPQAIELHLFVQQLGRCQKRATPESKPTTALPAKTITSIADIRHAAVHRHRLSSCDMINVLKDAERFLEFLGDTMRLRRITELRYSTHKDLASLERAEREADEALGRVRKRFDVKRRSLQLLEDDAALRVDRTREKFRGIAADRIAHAVLATREQEAATKRSKRVMEVFVLVATAFCSTISFCVRLLGTKGNFYKT